MSNISRAISILLNGWGRSKKMDEEQQVMPEKVTEKVEILELEPRAYNTYRNNTEGNASVTEDVARRKLTRNVLMGIKVPNKTTDLSKQLYLYGHLQILVVDGKRIVWVRNEIKECKFVPDVQRKEELNLLLGIPNNQVNTNTTSKSLDFHKENGRNNQIQAI